MIDGIESSTFDPMQGLAGTAQQINTNTTQNKIELLASKVQDKVSTLAGKWEPAVLESYGDSDSPTLAGVTGGKGRQGDLTGRHTEDRDPNFDAYEVSHPNDPYQNTPSGIAKYERQRQRLANDIKSDPVLAGKLGVKDVNNITNDDIVRAGTREQLLGLYNAIPGEKAAWEPGPLDYWTADKPAMELGSKDNPLNIQVERRYTGKIDNFGRPLAEIRNIDTKKTTSEALGYDGTEDRGYSADAAIANLKAHGRLTPELEQYLRKSTKYVNQPEQVGGNVQDQRHTAEELNKLIGLEDQLPSNNTTRGVGAAALDVGAKVGSLVGRGVEAVGQVTGSETATGVGKTIQDAYTKFQTENMGKEMTGYNDRDAQALQQEIDSTIKKDGYMAALGKAVTDSRSLEVLATSVPEMIALAASVGTMAVANANNDINIGQAKLGREYTSEEKAMATVSSVVGTYLDRLGDKLALSGMNGAKIALKEAVEKAPLGVQEALASRYGKNILNISEVPLKLAGSGAVEGGTEWAQTLTQTAAQNPDVFKPGYDFSDKAYDEAAVAGVLGAAMGTHMSAPSIAKDAIMGVELPNKNKDEQIREERSYQQKVELAKKYLANADATKQAFGKYKLGDGQARGELKNIATNLVNSGKDDLNILGSDMDEAEKAKRIRELVSLVAEDNDLDEGTVSKLKEMLTGKFEGVDQAVDAGIAEGKALKTLKSTEQVAGDVATGPRGFVTYYERMRAAEEVGDAEEVEKYKAKLENFAELQRTKRDRLQAAEDEVISKFNSQVKMTAEARGISLDDARDEEYAKLVKQKDNKTGGVWVSYGEGKKDGFNLYPAQVVEKVASGRADFAGGAYKFLSKLDDEISAMDSLIGKQEEEVVATPTTVAEKIAKGEEATLEDQQVFANNPDEVKSELDKLRTEVPSEKVEEVKTPNIPNEVPTDTHVGEVPDFNFNENPDDVNFNEVPSDEEFAKMVTERPEGVPTEVPADVNLNEVPGELPKKAKLELPERVKTIKQLDRKEQQIKEKLQLAKSKEEKEKLNELLDKIAVVRRQEGVFASTYKRVAALRGWSTGVAVKDAYKEKATTPLNTAKIEAEPEVVELVTKAISPAEITKDGKVNKQDSKDGDVGRVFLYNEDGSLNGNTAVALYTAMNNYLKVNLGKLGSRVDAEDLADMLPGLDKKSIDEQIRVMEHFSRGGMLMKFEANDLGADVVNMLGISAPNNVVDGALLKTSFGRMVIAMAEQAGYVEEHPLTFDGNKVPVMRATKRASKKYGAKIGNEAERYEVFETEDVKNKTYNFEKPESKGKSKVHNQPYTDTTELQDWFKKKLEGIEYKVNDGVNVLMEMYGKPEDREDLKRALGKEEILDNWSKDKKDATESSNNEIDTTADEFYKMLEKANGDEKKSLWFNYFVAKNGRTNLNSTTVNVQTDKKLARWLVTAMQSRMDVSKELIDEIKNGSKLSREAVGFLYGLVQAFDGVLPEKVEIDKNSQDKVVKMGRTLLAMSDTELEDLVKNGKVVGDKTERVEHLGHALLGLANVRKLNKGEPFTSDLVLETDGLTNGMAFRFVQFLRTDVLKGGLLDKVGVLLSGSKFYDAKTMAEVKEGKEFLDLYETVGMAMANSKPKLDGNQEKIKELLKDNLVEFNRENLKKLRSLAKSPVMVTGYSAGEMSTKAAIVKEQLDKLVNDIAEGKIDDKVVEELSGMKAEKFKELVRNNSIASDELSKFRTKMSVFYNAYYAEPMYDALMDVVGSVKEVGDVVLKAYEYMYEAMLQEYDKRLAAAVKAKGGDTLLGDEDRVKLVRGLLEEFGPIVGNSESTGDLDKVLALSRALKDMEEEAKAAGGLTGKLVTTVNSKLAGKDTRVKTLRTIMRSFGQPGAAGSVLQTHTEDNHTMARAMRDSGVGEFNQVFDAQVLGIGQLGAVQGYNKAFYELNKEFSMLDAVIEALERNVEGADKAGYKIDVGTKKKPMSGGELLDSLRGFKREIDKNRKELFGGEAKIGQMVGPDGLMHEVNAKQELARIEEMKKQMAESIKEFAKDSSFGVRRGLESVLDKIGCMKG